MRPRWAGKEGELVSAAAEAAWNASRDAGLAWRPSGVEKMDFAPCSSAKPRGFIHGCGGSLKFTAFERMPISADGIVGDVVRFSSSRRLQYIVALNRPRRSSVLRVGWLLSSWMEGSRVVADPGSLRRHGLVGAVIGQFSNWRVGAAGGLFCRDLNEIPSFLNG